MNRWCLGLIFTALGFLGATAGAQAETACEYYRRLIPGFKCNSGGANNTTSGTQSSISASAKVNPSSLATEPTGLGVEGLYSVIKGDSSLSYPNFGLVKGFQRKGAGLALGSSHNFYDNDLLRRRYATPDLYDFSTYEPVKGKFFDFTFAAALTLWQPDPNVKLNVGLSATYLYVPNTWGPGVSVLLSTPWLGIGTGVTRLKIATDLPYYNFVSSLVRLKLVFLDLEYNRLESSDAFNLGPIHIFTASLKLENWIFTAAQRQSRFFYAGYVHQYHYAIQYLLTNFLSLSYLNNMIPGCHTVGAQIYF